MKTKDHNKRTFARRAAMTLLAAVMTTMAWAQDPAPIGSIRYKAALGAYEINSVENLNDLAVYVSGIGQYKNGDNQYTYSDGTQANGVHDCAGMTFKMTADITFPHKAAGAEGADTEDNFTPIGLYYNQNIKPFCGHFDGFDPTDNSSHTISGIRINSDILSSQIGLFGSLGSGARVEGVTLADAVIGGESRLGGIAGDNKGGTVTHCTVRKSVAIVITKENDDIPSEGIGGIVGYNTKDTNGNLGIISHCTSSVQIGFIPGITRCRYTGGIVGYNVFCSLTDNIAIEATVPKSSNNNNGAIAGFISTANTGEIARNYYRHCTVAGVVNAIGKGIYNNDSDGALPLFSLTVPTGVTATTVTQPIRIADEDDDFYPSGTVFTLSGGLDDLDDPDDPDDGYMKGYTTTAGTVVGSTTIGFTLTLHGGDATIGTTSRFVIDWADESTGDDADHAYLIYNAEQLDLVARRVNDVNTRSTYKGKYYRLMNDINYSTANTDNNYTPIGRQYYPFQGHFDGGGHFVSGIRINRPNDSYLGLFGTINDGSTVSNVIVKDASITGYSYVGCIAGYAGNATLTANYYYDCSCTVGDAATATIGIGCNGADITDNDGALPLFSLTVPTGVTATTVTQPIQIADEDDLYPSGTVFTLNGGLDDLDNPAPGYMKGYTTTAGTVVGSTTSGFTLTLHGGDATIGTTSRFVIDWADESTGDDADHAYLIYNAEQLDLLARRVNDYKTWDAYDGKYYRLMKDIDYSTANTDNNYTPIGMLSCPFKGIFDGGGHTVSGIRIHKPGNSYLGLFGYVGEGSTVSNVIVSDARITGSSYVGCIAGYTSNATLTANYYYDCSCTVGDLGTAIPAGTGIGCNSADITDNDGAVPVFFIRRNRSEITIQPNPIFTVGDLGYYKPGTVITLSGGLPEASEGYYYAYTVNDEVITGNSFDVPSFNELGGLMVGVSDPIFDPDMLVLYDDQDNSEAIAAACQSNKTYNVRLSGHTLYKDGRWNPLCLPFDVVLKGSPLEGATVMTLQFRDYRNQGYYEGIVNLLFNAVFRMKAGIPYLVRWENTEGTETEMTSPLFRQVHFSTTQPASLTTFINDHDESLSMTFTGNYSPVTFTSAFKNVLFNDEGSTLGAFRAYLKIDSDEDLLLPPEPDDVFVGWETEYGNVSTCITDIAELAVDDRGHASLHALWVALGDVNGDGNVTPADAIMILYHYFGVAQKGFFKAAADINGDGTISPADAIEALYKYFNAAGARSSSPANPRDPD